MAGKKKPQPLKDTDLDAASGGMLLPAIQKVREAAARSTTSTLTKVGPGTIALNTPDTETGD